MVKFVTSVNKASPDIGLSGINHDVNTVGLVVNINTSQRFSAYGKKSHLHQQTRAIHLLRIWLRNFSDTEGLLLDLLPQPTRVIFSHMILPLSRYHLSIFHQRRSPQKTSSFVRQGKKEGLEEISLRLVLE